MSPLSSVVRPACVTGGRGVMSKEFGDELVTSHPHEPVDGVHRRPFADVTQGAPAGERMKIVAVDESSIHVEEDRGAGTGTHVGGSAR